MKYDIRDYVVTFKQVISNELRLEVLDNIEHTNYLKPRNFEDQSKANSEAEIAYDYVNTELCELISTTISRYYEYLDYPWAGGWTGCLTPRWHRYTENKFMHLHCDQYKEMFDGERKGNPTLTVLGLLNNKFQGGDFLMWEDEKIDFEAGDILIFPSTFQYPHRVAPVENGTRYTFVSWVW